MAYVSNSQDDEEPKNPAQGAVPPAGGAGGASVQLAPSSGIGSAGGASAPSQPGQPAAGGSFATLDKYISANQGQAEPLANKITSDIGNQYNTLQGQNTSTLNDINNQVKSASTPSNANDIIAQEAANPVSFANDKGNVGQFQSLLNASYGGPASAESTPGFTTQQNAVNNAIATGQQQTGSEAGRAQLLSQHEAAPSTSVTGLNSAILSQDPNAQGQIENAYKPFSNLLTGLNTGAQGIDQTIGSAQTNAQTTNAAANKQIADQINALNSNVNTELGDLQDKIYNAANTAETNLSTSLQNGKLPTGYGVDPGLQSFLDTNVYPWMTTNAPGVSNTYNFANAVPQFTAPNVPTIQQAATANDYAQAGAFQNLLNGINSGAPATIINPSDASKAGTYTTPALPSVNNQALAGDIYSGLNSSTGQINVGSKPFGQYNSLLAALDRYMGKTSDPNLYGGGGQLPSDFYTNPNNFAGYTPPTIA